MNLSKAETELVELIRSGAPFAVMLMRKENQGEIAVSTSAPPFGTGETRAAVEMTFEEGWRERKHAGQIAIVG